MDDVPSGSQALRTVKPGPLIYSCQTSGCLSDSTFKTSGMAPAFSFPAGRSEWEGVGSWGATLSASTARKDTANNAGSATTTGVGGTEAGSGTTERRCARQGTQVPIRQLAQSLFGQAKLSHSSPHDCSPRLDVGIHSGIRNNNTGNHKDLTLMRAPDSRGDGIDPTGPENRPYRARRQPAPRLARPGYFLG